MDVCTGRDSTWRDAGGADTMDIDIVPKKFWDSTKAKLYANLRWLCAKAYSTDIPEDIQDLSYVDQYDQEHIKPAVIRLLLSGELCCRVCGVILKDKQSGSRRGHQSVIKALLRKGIHVVEGDAYVSHHDLSSVPIKMSSHVALIDALMVAYTLELISTEKVGSVCKRFSGHSSFNQVSVDVENALLFWINKVVIKMSEIADTERLKKEQLLESFNYQKSPSKWYWKLVPGRCRDYPSDGKPHHFPLLDDLMNNALTGSALLTVIHFYCPVLISLEDICLKEIPTIAETISSIHLLMTFSNKYLNGFYLKIEDMLYCPPSLKNNIVAFIAELFWVFEIVKPNFVQPRDVQEVKAGPRSKTNYATCVDSELQDSILAWPERRKSPGHRLLCQPEPYGLHIAPEGESLALARTNADHQTADNTSVFGKHVPGPGLQVPSCRRKAHGLLGHVYISDEENEVEEEELVVIIHPTTLATSKRDTSPDGHYSAAFSLDHHAQESFYLEPLMPAVSKPAKEKSISLNKQEESGESRARAAGGRMANISTYSATQKGAPVAQSLDLKTSSVSLTVTPSECGDDDGSRCPSPCLSTTSHSYSSSASDCSGVRMTTFADQKLQKMNLKNCCSSSSSSQRTTPDDSEIVPFPLRGSTHSRAACEPCWQGKESGSVPEKEDGVVSPVVCSELVQLHMKLVEQQRAIESQKKKMETLITQQRLELGKAAFLNVIKKGGVKSDTLPRPLKGSPEFSDILASEGSKGRIHPSKDDSCLDKLSVKEITGHVKLGQVKRDNRLSPASLAYVQSEPDPYGFCHSLENLNKSVSSIQQKIMQLSLQQSRLMKQGLAIPTCSPDSREQGTTEGSVNAQSTPVTGHYAVVDCALIEDISLASSAPAQPPAKRQAPTKSSGFRMSKEDDKPSTKHSNRPANKHSSNENIEEQQEAAALVKSPKTKGHRNSMFTVHFDTNTTKGKGTRWSSEQVQVPQDDPVTFPCAVAETEGNEPTSAGSGAPVREERGHARHHLIEVGQSDEDAADISDCRSDSEPKNVLGFFYKGEGKPEDEMAKRRAAFLLKQERKAEEARLRKLQQEAENELKRDEARHKAEEERVRKEEEKMRRELIKQDYLQRKRQELLEDEAPVKPRVKSLRTRRSKEKSPNHPQFNSLSEASIRDDLSSAHQRSTLSLTAEVDDVTSGRAQRSFSRCSEDSFSVMSVDWDRRSTASFTFTADYNGPKLFKEPTSKSNKSIIINAVAHCCLAGKVNEAQKNVVLEELEKCKSNHLLILLRDGGCQYRAIYCYLTDTGEIIKFLGTGPRAINQKMIDKLYKYSCDRKQFAVIPTKTLSITVDALTIHNHFWQVKRKGSLSKK